MRPFRRFLTNQLIIISCMNVTPMYVGRECRWCEAPSVANDTHALHTWVGLSQNSKKITQFTQSRLLLANQSQKGGYLVGEF